MTDWLAGLDFTVVWRYRYALLSGLETTLFLSFVGLLGGLVLGGVIALGTSSRRRWLMFPIRAVVEFLRSTPLLMQAIWVQFAMPVLLGFSLAPIQSALLALTLNVAAYASEVIRAGIGSVGGGQVEAARALALPTWVIWARIILPQALRTVLPPLTSMAISTIKASAILSILAVNDLMRVAMRINGLTYRPVELFTAAAVLYLAVGLIVGAAGRWAESHWGAAPA
jgi:polar amino acid transport system permease protein